MLRFCNAHRVLVPVVVVAASLLLGIACGAANHRGGTADPTAPAGATATSAVTAIAASPTPLSITPALAAVSSSAVAGGQAAPNIGARLPRANATGSARRGAAGRGAQAESCSEVRYDSNGAPVSAYLCLPSGAGPWPAVVVLHGAEGPAINPGYRLIAQGLAEAGFAALQVDYFSQTPGGGTFGIPPESDYEKDASVWLREIGDAVSYLQARPEIDPQRIGLNGYSLGAFMALDAAMLDPRAKAVVEFYGGVVPGLARNLGQMPPVLILHGDADSIVPVNYAHALQDLLSAHGRPYEIQIYAGAQHGFNFFPGADAQDAYARMGAFLDKWLAAPNGGQ